jgi:hypothetical protein
MLTNSFVVEKTHELTDNIMSELRIFYPDVFQSSMLNYTFAMLDFVKTWLDEIAGIATPEAKDASVKRFAHYTQAEKFSGKSGMEIAYEKNFDEICIILNQSTSSDIREKTVREFYGLYDYLQKQADELHIQKSRQDSRKGR